MPQSNKKEIEKAPAKGQQRRRTAFIIGAVVIIIILVLLGGGYYQNYVAPFQLTIITVDDTTIRMDYFLKRAKFNRADPMSMLKRLTDEQLIKLGAPRYGIVVSSENITNELRRIARGNSEAIAESEFQAWYRQMLNDSGLSEAEFRDTTATMILATRLQDYQAEIMPTVAEQVHLNAILLATYEEAQQVKARVEKGEVFADLARAVSLDNTSKAGGGDLGWLPRGVLDTRFENTAFNLIPGAVSIPIPQVVPSPADMEASSTGGYFLFMVSEKAAAREVAAEFLPILKSQALEKWLLAESQLHDIKYNFNSEINAWLNWQLSKTQPSSTGQEPTQQ